MLVVIEGCNASGKSYLLQQLKSELESRGKRVLSMKTPLYEIQSDGIDNGGPDIYKYLHNDPETILKYNNNNPRDIDVLFKRNRLYV